MAWSSFFAGVAGAAFGFEVRNVTSFPFGPPFEEVLLAMTLGYVLGAGLDLAIPGQSTMSWKEFWVPMVVAILPGAALFALQLTTVRTNEFALLTSIYPVVAFLLTRAIIAAVNPFDPWFDDLAPPFRAEPIISLTPSGAMVGLAANW